MHTMIYVSSGMITKNKGNDMNHTTEHQEAKYGLKDFLPLIIIASAITVSTAMHQFYYGFDSMAAMRIFMAFFFLVFGFFKVVNLNAFAKAYAEYDIIAKRFYGYGYIYPFIELGLGVAYLVNFMPVATNLITLILMLISAWGVFVELRKGRTIVCACLGVVFKLPMTWVTLSEDLIMALMALVTLIMLVK